MRTPRVLVHIAFDPAIERLVRRVLKKQGYQVYAQPSKPSLLETIGELEPDLLILDTPALCTPLRRLGMQMPIMIISEVREEQDIVRALDQGADDVVQTPCGRDELAARIRALLRRALRLPDPSPKNLHTKDGYLTLDVEQQRAYLQGQEVRLTPTEFALLCFLMNHEGNVLTHRLLLRAIWGPAYGEEADYLRVYIRHLRQKIEADPSHPCSILTEPGVGYVFHAAPPCPLSKGNQTLQTTDEHVETASRPPRFPVNESETL